MDRSAGNRTTVSDWELLTQTRFCASMAMPKGDFRPCDLHDASVLHPSAGEIQQLVFRAIGDPDVTVRGDTDAHQSAELAGHREVAFLADGIAVEIHHQNRPVEAADPDFVERHAGAPPDAVHAHAGEAGDRRRERGSVGGELDHAAADVATDAGLRAGHPVLAAPEIAIRIEHELAIGAHPAAGETEREGEVGRSVSEIRHEGRLAPGAVLRLRVGFVEQRVECFRLGPRRAGDAGHRFERVLRRRRRWAASRP